MSKIVYDDPDFETGNKIIKRKSPFSAAVIAVILCSLIFGAVGGIGGILLVSSNSSIAKKLGFSGNGSISIPTTTTEKVVVQESSAIIDSANKVSPAVVSITTKSTVQDIFGQVSQSESAGTGFVITSDGLILTNKHVVSDQTAAYTVVMSDGKSYDAKVQSVDPLNDLAVVKIDARNLPVVELGDSDQLQVGQWVVAVGNALGKFQNTVTAGVVSAKGRSIQASDSGSGSNSENLSGLLQTDAAINPGNSGGPLVNLKGQVVGIDTAVAADAQGIGFAIPINAAKSAIDSIKKTGQIIRPYLGVRYVQITPDLAQQNNLPYNYGALIARGSSLTDFAVVPGSPADKAGIIENDIILEVNGEKIDENHDLLTLIQQYNIGDEIELKVSSKGKEKTVKVKLEQSK